MDLCMYVVYMCTKIFKHKIEKNQIMNHKVSSFNFNNYQHFAFTSLFSNFFYEYFKANLR
jgi:hypothetical protein